MNVISTCVSASSVRVISTELTLPPALDTDMLLKSTSPVVALVIVNLLVLLAPDNRSPHIALSVYVPALRSAMNVLFITKSSLSESPVPLLRPLAAVNSP